MTRRTKASAPPPKTAREQRAVPRAHAPPPHPPTLKPRTFEQAARDAALAIAGYTARDVHRYALELYGEAGPSMSSVNAVLKNRYRDERVHRAFVALVEPPIILATETGIAKAIEKHFPKDEPLFRG